MISYDVFGTCLVRIFGHPADLYLVLAENILSGKGKGADKEWVAELARIRTAAVDVASRSTEREAIRLEDIYCTLELDDSPISPREMMLEELRLELGSVRPVMQIKREIEELRRTGERIVFISDTPLPSGHLRDLLEKWGFAEPGDRVYVSSDVGFRKTSGRLFRHVLEAEGLDASELIHRGDHQVADISSPQTLGIQVDPFSDAELNRYERMMLTDGSGDRSVRSRIAGVSRATRLMSDIDTVRFPGLTEMVANVVAPLLTCFVAWLLNDAREAGLDRLYFMSRDGEILQRIAEQLAGDIPAPELRYLHGSRQPWLLAATTTMTSDELAWIFNDSTTLRDLLGKLALDPSDVLPALRVQGLDRVAMGSELSPDEMEHFWRVLEQPDITGLILQQAAETREISLAYFAQEGLTDGSKWGLVDVGWKLQSQWALRRMLSTIGRHSAVNGYYLAVARKRRRMANTGPYRALYLPEEHEEAQILHRHAVLIEEVFLPASHGPVLGYQDEGGIITPVMRSHDPYPDLQAYRLAVEQVLLTYAAEAAAAGILDSPGSLDALGRSTLRVVKRFLTDPTHDEAQAVAWMTASDDPFHHPEQHRPLVKPYGLPQLFGLLATRVLRRSEKLAHVLPKSGKPHWSSGSMALTRPWLAKLYRSASNLQFKPPLRRS